MLDPAGLLASLPYSSAGLSMTQHAKVCSVPGGEELRKAVEVALLEEVHATSSTVTEGVGLQIN